MAFDGKSLDDYIDVAQRIADFRERYPEGTLQPAEPVRIVQVQCEWCRQCIGRRSVKVGKDSWKTCPRCDGSGLRGQGEPVLDTYILHTAAAYRTPDDTRPGIGTAWEAYPGTTPYTAFSELMNAETSAWGRAIIAVGASDAKRGVASRDEVRNRRAEREDGLPVNRDGSLSRSQTTDAEKAAAGVMTSGQHAEHTALAKGADGKLPAADRGRSQRVTATPPDDPWYDASGPPLPGQPAKGGKPSLSKMFGRYAQLGITDDMAMRADIAAIIGREVESRSSLTFAEVSSVNAALLDRLAESGVPAR